MISNEEKHHSKYSFSHSEQQRQFQQQKSRSVILPSKPLLYNCLHRSWIRAYAFSNICLSVVYFIILTSKHYDPNFLCFSSIKFYSLPLILVQQISINFSTFHLFIISISILEYFIRYRRLLKNKYSLNTYNGKKLLITKHTNVALILSSSFALIFGYNYIFYSPEHSVTIKLLPLVTFNMVLLPLLDLIIFIFIIICCFIDFYRHSISIKHDLLFDTQTQQQHPINDVRSTIKQNACIKCYTKFLQENRSLFRASDLFTDLHSKALGNNRVSGARLSLTPLNNKLRYSTTSYENIPTMNENYSNSLASFPCQTTGKFLLDKCAPSQQEFFIDQQNDLTRISTSDLCLQTTLIRLKRYHSFCHMCYRFLLVFLLKYALFTFPQHFIQMVIHCYQFYQYIRGESPSNDNGISQHLSTPKTPSAIAFTKSELMLTVCRLIFLFARFGDSLLLTRLPHLIKKYSPCWCRLNSKFLYEQKPFQRIPHQILTKNTNSPANEPISDVELSNSNDLFSQQESQSRRQRQVNTKRSSHTSRHHFRLRFQFTPIWSMRPRRVGKEDF